MTYRNFKRSAEEAVSNKDYDAAEKAWSAALKEAEQFAVDDPRLVQAIDSLADVLINQERFVEAEELLKRSIEIKKGQLGPDHVETAGSLQRLADAFAASNKVSEAEQIYDQVFRNLAGKFGEQAPDVRSIKRKLAILRGEDVPEEIAPPPRTEAAVENSPPAPVSDAGSDRAERQIHSQIVAGTTGGASMSEQGSGGAPHPDQERGFERAEEMPAPDSGYGGAGLPLNQFERREKEQRHEERKVDYSKKNVFSPVIQGIAQIALCLWLGSILIGQHEKLVKMGIDSRNWPIAQGILLIDAFQSRSSLNFMNRVNAKYDYIVYGKKYSSQRFSLFESKPSQEDALGASNFIWALYPGNPRAEEAKVEFLKTHNNGQNVIVRYSPGHPETGIVVSGVGGDRFLLWTGRFLYGIAVLIGVSLLIQASTNRLSFTVSTFMTGTALSVFAPLFAFVYGVLAYVMALGLAQFAPSVFIQ